MGIWLVARDNIKKKKGNAVLLLLMIAFAVMLLYVGISVLTNLNRDIKERNDLIHGADFLLISPNENESKILDEIKKRNEVEFAESEKGLYQVNTKYYPFGKKADTPDSIDYLFQKKDVERKISMLTMIEEGKEWTQDSIILPYYMRVGLGYKTGDVISLEIKDKVYNFTVYGFMDDIMFCTPTNISTVKVFIDNKKYEELADLWKQEVTIYKAVTKPGIDREDFESSMDEQLKISVPGYKDLSNKTLNYSTMSTGSSISALIFMGILTVFAILLILITMVIINFNITNSIERNMKNIGILQACGYTRRQLVAATIIEIIVIGSAGMAVGLILAEATSGVVGGIIASSIGMYWSIGFDVASAAYSILITLGMVLLAAYIGASKFRRINVLDALRNGIRTHNFKKSHVRLDKTSLPLNIALGIKNILSKKTKNLVVALVIAFLTFCSNAALSLYQNFVQDSSNLINITGFEVPAIGVNFDKSSEYTQQEVNDIEKRIRNLDDVKEVKQYTCYDLTCTSEHGSEALNCDAYNDTNLEVDNIVEGRNPQSEDEIMLSTVMTERLKVGIGGIVYLEMNGKKMDYIVCGMFQGINHLGKKALVSLDGIRRLEDKILPDILYVYHSDSGSIEDLMSTMKIELKDDNVTVTNFQEYISTFMAAVLSIMKIFSYLILVAVGLVIALVMIFLVRTQLVKDSRQYGIYKALGYTTPQLLLQMIMNYLPVVFAGALIGCILSIFLMNPLFISCLSMFGIKKCSMELGFLYMTVMFAVIMIWSLLIILMNSIKIRKIVPCEMIQEN